MRIVAAAVSTVVMGFALAFTPRGQEESVAQHTQHVRQAWIKVVFGVDGEPAVWNGRLQIENGRVLEMADWGFEDRDQLDTQTASWKIQTGIPQGRRVTFAEPQRGLLVKLDAKPATVVEVETEQGAFRFAPAKLVPGRPTKLLDGRVTVEPLGTAELVAETETDDDFAAIAVDAEGHRHVAWIAFDEETNRERLLVRDVDQPANEIEVIAVGEEFAAVHLLSSQDGPSRAVWCSPGVHKNWDVYTAVRETRGWRTERLTTAELADMHLAAHAGSDGTVWLAWQSFRNGHSDIYAKCLRDGTWSNDVRVTENSANDWEPAVSVDAKGNAWIAYDTYRHGNYDVYLNQVSVGGDGVKVSAPTAIATSADFEAHASVLVGDGGRVWVAYDAAGPNWGKDFRNRPTITDGRYAEPLHASRRLELRCVVDGEVQQPTVPLPQVLPPDRIHVIDRGSAGAVTRFYEYPQLARDGDDRLWLFFRMCRQGYVPHPPRGLHWKICTTSYTENGWLEPIELPRSQGRQNQRVALTAGPDKRLHCAWSDGDRFASVDRKYAVFHGELPQITETAATIPCDAAPPGEPGMREETPPPPFTLKHAGKEYHLFYGDLHRHTNISRCAPTIDGSLVDAHRYALDAAELDFLSITDHTRDVGPYAWWRTQKAADWFHVPGRYVPIYGYERSNMTPGGGHRNVFFLERGRPINPSDHYYEGRGLEKQNADPDKTLYPWMKEHGPALTSAHTPAYDRGKTRGTWSYNDPDVEPVAEIYQAFRRSYERPDGGVSEEASLWYALKQGYRLGFIASSDHLGTHTSYACVWATEKTREAIFEAIQSRRTFGATDRIALVTRIGDAVMGEETLRDGERVTLQIQAEGTAPVTAIEIIRGGEVVDMLKPNRVRVETEYVDANPPAGNTYYYVRLVQQDGGTAWASPIWVARRKQ